MAVEHRILFILWFILKAQLIYNKTKVSFVGKKKIAVEEVHGGQFEFKAATRNHETYDWNVNACTCCCGRYNIRKGVTTRSWRLYIESSTMTSCFADCLKVSSYRYTRNLLFSMFKHGFLTTNRIVIIKVGSIIEKDLSSGFTVCLKVFTIVELLSLSLLRRT